MCKACCYCCSTMKANQKVAKPAPPVGDSDDDSDSDGVQRTFV